MAGMTQEGLGTPTGQPDKPSPRGPKKRLKRRFKVLIGVAVLLLLGLFSVWFLLFCRWGLFDAANPHAPNTAKEQSQLGFMRDGIQYRYNTDIVNILILGIDEAQEGVGIGQADTIIVFSINLDTREVCLLPIPRDALSPVYLDLQGQLFLQSLQPVCLAHAYASTREEGGATMRAVASYLLYDLPIHGFASVDMKAIIHLTDYLGGVPVPVTYDFSMASGLDTGDTLLLDGDMAEQYLRGRSMGGMDGTNLSRMMRQRVYLKCLFDVVKQKIKGNLFSLFDIYNVLQPYLTTDLGFREIVYLGYRVIQLQDFTFQEIPTQLMDGKEYIDDDFMRDYIRSTYFVAD